MCIASAVPKSRTTDPETAAAVLFAGATAAHYGVVRPMTKRALTFTPQTPSQRRTRGSSSAARPRARRNWLQAVRAATRSRIMNRINSMRARFRRGPARAPKYPVGPYQGRFKQRRIAPTKVTGNKETVYGTIDGQNATYGGFFKNGGRKKVIRELVEQLLKTIIRQRKITCASRDSIISWLGDQWYGSSHGGQAPTQLQFLFHEKDKDGIYYTTTVTQNLLASLTDGTYYYTFDGLVDLLVPLFETALNSDERFLYGYKLTNTYGGSEALIQERSLSEWKITMTVRCNMKIQNITPADLGGETAKYDKDNIANNPLMGRVFTFSGGVPRLRGQFAGAIAGMHHVSDTDDADGLIVFPDQTNTVYDNGNALHIVPKGTTLFENCTHSTAVALSPGGYKNVSTLFTFSGTLKQFTKKLALATGEPFKFGETVCFGFEPAMRTAENEAVKLAYHLDVLTHCTLWPRHKIYVQQRNKSTVRNIS